MLSRRDFLKIVAATPIVASFPMEAISRAADLDKFSSILSEDENLNVAVQTVAQYLRKYIPISRISRQYDKGFTLGDFVGNDKHLNVSMLLSAKEQSFTSEEFKEHIAIPAAKALTNMINSYDYTWTYNTIVLLNPATPQRCVVFNYKGISVRGIYGYHMETKRSTISFDTMLKRRV